MSKNNETKEFRLQEKNCKLLKYSMILKQRIHIKYKLFQTNFFKIHNADTSWDNNSKSACLQWLCYDFQHMHMTKKLQIWNNFNFSLVIISMHMIRNM